MATHDSDLVDPDASSLTQLGRDRFVAFLGTGYERWDDYADWARRSENREEHLRRVRRANSALAGALAELTDLAWREVPD